MAWRWEDGGPRRTALAPGGLGITPADRLVTTSRVAPAFTMLVAGGGRLYALRHTAGEGATALVERIDPGMLEPLATSEALAGGPVWPGGVGVHGAGTLHVQAGAGVGALRWRRRPRRRPHDRLRPVRAGRAGGARRIWADRHAEGAYGSAQEPRTQVPGRARQP